VDGGYVVFNGDSALGRGDGHVGAGRHAELLDLHIAKGTERTGLQNGHVVEVDFGRQGALWLGKKKVLVYYYQDRTGGCNSVPVWQRLTMMFFTVNDPPTRRLSSEVMLSLSK
jgi:hypothetical protein